MIEPCHIRTDFTFDEKRRKYRIDVKKEIKMKDRYPGPDVKKGQELGTLVLKKDGKVLAESPVVAEKDMDKAGMWTMFKRTMRHWTKWSE